jgi:hypothetical protein
MRSLRATYERYDKSRHYEDLQDFLYRLSCVSCGERVCIMAQALHVSYLEETSSGTLAEEGNRLLKAVHEDSRSCSITASFLITGHRDFSVLLGALFPKGDQNGAPDSSRSRRDGSRALAQLFERWAGGVQRSMDRVDCSRQTGDPRLVTGLTTEEGLNQRWYLLRNTLFRGDNHFVRALCDMVLSRDQEHRFITTATARRLHFRDSGSRTANVFWRILEVHFRSDLDRASQCHEDYGELSAAFRGHLGAFVNLHPFFATTARGSLETGQMVYNPGKWEEETIHQRERKDRRRGAGGNRR